MISRCFSSSSPLVSSSPGVSYTTIGTPSIESSCGVTSWVSDSIESPTTATSRPKRLLISVDFPVPLSPITKMLNMGQSCFNWENTSLMNFHSLVSSSGWACRFAFGSKTCAPGYTSERDNQYHFNYAHSFTRVAGTTEQTPYFSKICIPRLQEKSLLTCHYTHMPFIKKFIFS